MHNGIFPARKALFHQKDMNVCVTFPKQEGDDLERSMFLLPARDPHTIDGWLHPVGYEGFKATCNKRRGRNVPHSISNQRPNGKDSVQYDML